MSLQHLILGILKYQPLSGYDLNKAFQASVQHFWNTEQSQIYRALYRLAEAGWVETEAVAQAQAPDKKVYHLTPSGRAELLRWLAAPGDLAATREAWLGQLFFGAELSQAQLRALLEQRQADLEAELAVFTHDVAAGAARYAEAFAAARDLPFWLFTLQYGIEKLEFELGWVRRALARLRAGDL